MAGTGEICRYCKYYEQVTDEKYGECKRYAPRPEVEESKVGCQPIWPTVVESMWRGEFESRQ